MLETLATWKDGFLAVDGEINISLGLWIGRFPCPRLRRFVTCFSRGLGSGSVLGMISYILHPIWRGSKVQGKIMANHGNWDCSTRFRQNGWTFNQIMSYSSNRLRGVSFGVYGASISDRL